MTIAPSPLINPARVNNQGVGPQDYLSTTQLANGDIIAVWQSQPADYNGVDAYSAFRVVLQRFDASGNETGPEVDIGTNPTLNYPNQFAYMVPQVAALVDGGYAVAYVEAIPAVNGYSTRVLVNLYDSDGTGRASTVIPNPEITLTHYWDTVVTTNPTTNLKLVPLGNGGVAAVWEASYAGMFTQYVGGQTNYVQHIGSDGTLDGLARAITPVVGTGSYSVDYWNWGEGVAPMMDGGYVVIYRGGKQSPGNATDKPVIMAQTFDDDGVATGQPFVIFEPVVANNFSQTNASIAALAGGGFVVVWTATNIGIQGQRFDADFNPVGGMFAAVPPEFGGGVATVSATPDGGFIVTQGGMYTKRSFRYDADGAVMGEQYEIATRDLFPGVSYFGGAYTNAPGHWEFAADGSPVFFVVGNAFAASDHADVWVQRFRPEIFGTNGNDTLTASDAGLALRGLGGNDRLIGGQGHDHLSGGDGNDTLLGGAGNDTLVAGAGNDQLDGGAGADVAIIPVRLSGATVSGPANALVLTHAGGQVTLAGIETVIFDGGRYASDIDTRTQAELLILRNRVLNGTSGNDTLTGDWGDDRLSGYGGHDRLLGGEGNDTLLGSDGNDTLLGEGGNDRLEGGTGADQLDGGSGDDWLDGGAANDTLRGGLGNDTLMGGTEDDHLYGDAGRDEVYGGAGNDRIWGGAGADLALGGTGNDTIYGGDSADTLHGEDGDDLIFGESGNDLMTGGAGNDRLRGEIGNDTLQGGDGNDSLYGATGNDLIEGGAGNDFIAAAAGFDTVFGGEGDDQIFGGGRMDELFGEAGNDTIFGDSGRDLLDGGAGNDVLDGGTGNDTLIGGAGRDTLTGGTGADVFVFAAADSLAETPDLITDFRRGVDKIDLTALGGVSFVTFFTGAGNEVRFDLDTRSLLADLTGDGIADFGVELQIGSVTAGDLIL